LYRFPGGQSQAGLPCGDVIAVMSRVNCLPMRSGIRLARVAALSRNMPAPFRFSRARSRISKAASDARAPRRVWSHRSRASALGYDGMSRQQPLKVRIAPQRVPARLGLQFVHRYPRRHGDQSLAALFGPSLTSAGRVGPDGRHHGARLAFNSSNQFRTTYISRGAASGFRAGYRNRRPSADTPNP
jgi:hypothetical protein